MEKQSNMSKEQLLKEVQQLKAKVSKLRETERQSEVWLENSPICTKILDLDFNLEYMSTAGIKELKIDDINKFYGKPYPFYFFPDEFKVHMTNNLKKTKESGEIIQIEGTLADSKGNELLYEHILTPVNDDKGKLDYIMVLSSEISELKLAEQKVNESEERFRTAFESTSDCILIWDKDYNYLFANQAAIDHVGTTREKVVGKNIVDGLGHIPDFMHLWMSRVDKVFETNKVLHVQDESTLFGKQIVTDSIISPIHSSNGSINAVCVVYRNVTELKRVQHELQQGEESQRELLKNLNSGVVVHNPDTTVTYANPLACNILGLSEDQMMGKKAIDPHWKFLKDDNTELPLNEYPINQVLSEGKPINNIVLGIFRPQENDVMWVLVSGYPVFDESKKITQVVISFYDITERRLANNELIESKERYRSLLSILTSAIWVTDPEGQFVEPQLMFEEFTGQPWEEHKGFGWASMVHPDDQERVGGQWMAAVKDKSVYHTEGRIMRASGNYCFFEADATPIFDDSGNVKEWVGTLIDISERKLAEDEFRRLFQSVALPLCYVDNKGVITIRNKRFIETFGYTETDVPTDNEWWLNAYPDEKYRKWVIQNWETAVAEAAKTGNDIKSDEYNITCKDGSVRTVIISGSVIEENFLATFIDVTDRKKAESELIESEKNYRRLFENMTSGFVLFEVVTDDNEDPIDLTIISANENFGKTTGLNVSEVINKRLTKVLPGIENDEADWIGTYGTIAIGGESKQFEQGSELLGYFYSVTAYQSQTGQCAVLFNDITEYKKVQNEVIRTKALLSETEKTGKIGGWVVDLETMTQTWTEETYRIHELDLNYKPDVAKGLDFYAPSSKPAIEKAFNNTIETGEPFDLELEFITAKGNHIWVHSVGNAQQVDGVTTSVSGSFQDITDRKKAQEELRESEKKFRSLSKISPVGVFITDVEGKTTYWNDRLCKITGMSVEEGKGTGWVDGIHPDDKENVFAEWYKSTEARSNFNLEYRFVDQEGNVTWTIGQATPLKNSNDELIGYVGSITDITKQKQIEEELLKYRQQLEFIVSERTKELEEQNKKLDSAMKVFVGREIKINELEKKLRAHEG